jgi:hypothetical protein
VHDNPDYSPISGLGDPYALFINGGYEADTMIKETSINFGTFNIPLEPRWYGDQVRDIDLDGREEIPSPYFPTSNSSAIGFGNYRLELNDGEFIPITTQPNVSIRNIQPVYRPGSGNRQAFYAEGFFDEKPCIFRLDIEAGTGKVDYRPIFELPASRYSFLRQLSAVWDIASILPLDGGVSYDLAFDFYVGTNDPSEFTWPGKPRLQFNQDATTIVDTSVFSVTGHDFEHVELLGDGRIYLVEKQTFSIYLDDNRDYVPDSTIIEGGFNNSILYIEDMNNDGLLDFVTVGSILFLQSDFSFNHLNLLDDFDCENYNPSTFLSLQQLQILDANEDGFMDVLIPGSRDLLFLNNGDETFLCNRSNTRAFPRGLLGVEKADVDGDGATEHLFYGASKIWIYDTIMHAPPPSIHDVPTLPYAGIPQHRDFGPLDRPFLLADIDIRGDNGLVQLFFNESTLIFLGDYSEQPAPPPSDIPSVPPSSESTSHYAATVYPNPTADVLKIRCTDCSTKTPVVLRIYNPSGSIQASYAPQPITTGWNVRQLSPGQYFYQVLQGSEVIGSGFFLKQ